MDAPEELLHLVIGRAPQPASLRLVRHPDDADDYVTRFRAIAEDEDLRATVSAASSLDDLPAFLRGLAEDFRGWEGARTWSSWGRELAASAVHRPRGHVAVTWTLSRGFPHADGWTAAITTVVEAGAEMHELAADVAVFIAGGVGGTRAGGPGTRP